MKSRLPLALLIALVVASPAVAATSKYTGKTNQDLSIKITVKGGAIDSLLVYVKNSCGATKKPIKVGGPIEVKENGEFSANLGSGALRFSGRFDAAKVSGKLRERVADPIGGGTCDTKQVTFTAKR